MRRIIRLGKRIAALLILAAFVLAVLVMLQYTLGIRLPVFCASVASGSMEPEIHIGEMILVSRTAEWDVGDVITYQDGAGQLITHRILSADGNTVIAKGDANTQPDPPVAANQIAGKVIGHFPTGNPVAVILLLTAGMMAYWAMKAV